MNNLEKLKNKFKFNKTLIKEYKNWYWLIRPSQVTLGSGILLSKHNKSNYSDLDKESFLELKFIITEIESTLKRVFSYTKINYLMLMMDDPVVHYHIIPRYDNDRKILKIKIKDYGYPGPPNLKKYHSLNDNEILELKKQLEIK